MNLPFTHNRKTDYGHRTVCSAGDLVSPRVLSHTQSHMQSANHREYPQ